MVATDSSREKAMQMPCSRFSSLFSALDLGDRRSPGRAVQTQCQVYLPSWSQFPGEQTEATGSGYSSPGAVPPPLTAHQA